LLVRFLAYCLTLKKEAVLSSKTSFNVCPTTQDYIPEDTALQIVVLNLEADQIL
jgi:hypothetical protein